MRKLWIPVIIGSLLVSAYTADKVKRLPDTFFEDFEQYRVKEHDQKVGFVLELAIALTLVAEGIKFLINALKTTEKVEIIR